ncbi:anhydro-N-acetylmuramic acid kinase [Paracoccus pacificus]|uniref:Anhydro-N-acetylmuramic acid kinase n=1 Tax=Paracoccus pacificus TaxID=1463598 RepID=A0ABW4RAD6_9RHOB
MRDETGAGPIWAVGAMSGTSLDGVDAAAVLTDGRRIVEFGRSAYRAYNGNETAVLHAALGLWPGDPGVDAAAELSETAHAEVLAGFAEARIFGYHGQTLAHDPRGRGTHQAGRGWRLAQALGRPVVWDFRTEDVRRGGEGAPLAPFFHFACAKWAIAQGNMPRQPVAFLNLGGVGNMTLVDPAHAAPEEDGACIAFDTGPANAPLNDLMRVRLGRARDESGQLAAAGQPDPQAVAAFLGHPYFTRPLPKSLDRDGFPDLLPSVAELSDSDAAATLVEVIAASVAAGVDLLPTRPERLLVCGGGRHNPVIMRRLAALTGLSAEPVEAIGLDGDMLEAQAFAWLAARVLRGLPTSGPSTTAVPRNAGGGRISFPRG